MNESKFQSKVTASLERSRELATGIKPKGLFRLEHYDKDGNHKGTHYAKNGVVNEGLDEILDVMFHAVAQTTVWYLSFIDSSGYSALAAADTMASHAGWTEFVAYTEATRPIWTEDAASSQTISNSVAVDFNINGSGTLKGVFCTSVNTKSGATGILWATALFSAAIPVTSGDLIKITYTVQAS